MSMGTVYRHPLIFIIFRRRKVPEGWKHVYLDVGNHLAIKNEYYEKAMNILKNYSNIDITFGWEKLLLDGGFIS